MGVIRARFMVGGLSALLALGGLAWAVQEPVVLAHMDYQAARPLSPDEARLIASCQDPGWTAISRLVIQDLDVGECDPLWVSRVAAGVAGERELGWISRVRAEEGRSVRSRTRLDLALLLAGHPPSPDLAMLVADPRTADALRDRIIDVVLAGEIAAEWTDPALRGAVATRRFEQGDWEGVWTFERELRLVAADLRPTAPAERARLARVALDAVDVSPDGLRIAFESRSAGYPWRGQPDHLSIALARRGRACLDPGSAACLALAADLLVLDVEEQQWHGDGGSWLPDPAARPAPVVLPMPVWNGLYGASPDLTRAAAEELGAWASFVTEAPPGERGARLLGSVAPPRSRYGRAEAVEGRLGDPVHAVALGGSGPWTSALAALAVGDAAGLSVTVHGHSQGVVLRTEGGAVGVGFCGVRFAPPDKPGRPVGVQRVLAGAAVEAAGGALARQDVAAARRLAGVAERLDPEAARGVQAMVDEIGGVPPDADHRLGWSAGALFANVGVAPEQGAPPVLHLGGRLRTDTACP